MSDIMYVSNEKAAEKVDEALDIVAEAIGERGGVIGYSIDINTPVDDIATVELNIEVEADDKIIYDALALIEEADENY